LPPHKHTHLRAHTHRHTRIHADTDRHTQTHNKNNTKTKTKRIENAWRTDPELKPAIDTTGRYIPSTKSA